MNALNHPDVSDKDYIISLEKGLKPDPREYLSQEEIKNHLSLFDDGAVRIQSAESFEAALSKYGSVIGDPMTGTFVMPKSYVENAIMASDGNPRVLEQLLGLDSGYLGETPILVDIIIPENIRVPSGNEAGAWPEFWVPGGFTSGGVPEAVIDAIQVIVITFLMYF